MPACANLRAVHNSAMQTHYDIALAAIDQAGDIEALAKRVGVKKAAVWSWRQRGRIPPIHWPVLVDMGVANLADLRKGYIL